MRPQSNAVIYCRVSTDAQERDGTSLESQAQACRIYAESQGWTITAVVKDTASGATTDRPGLNRIVSLMHRGQIDVVLAYAVDRLSRNQNHIGRLLSDAEDANVRLEFVTERFEDTAVGRFILSARAFVSEIEREKILERTTRGKAERAKSGRLPQGTGHGCYGYRYDPAIGKRLVQEYEAAIVRWMFEQSASGVAAYSIAKELIERGIDSPQKGRWDPRTVTNILRNTVYIGKTWTNQRKRSKVRGEDGTWKNRMVQRPPEEWVEIPGATPAIVSDELYSSAKRRLDSPRINPVTMKHRNYLLTGLIRCGTCQSPMNGHSVNHGKNTYYRCRGTQGTKVRPSTCHAKEVHAVELEQLIFEELKKAITQPEVVIAEMRRRQTEGRDFDGELADIDGRLKSLDNQHGRLVKLLRYGEVDDPHFEQNLNEIRRLKSGLTRDKNELLERKRQQADYGRMETEVVGICQRMSEKLDDFTGDDIRLVFEAVDLRVIVHSRAHIQLKWSIPLESFPSINGFVTTGQTSA